MFHSTRTFSARFSLEIEYEKSNPLSPSLYRPFFKKTATKKNGEIVTIITTTTDKAPPKRKHSCPHCEFQVHKAGSSYSLRIKTQHPELPAKNTEQLVLATPSDIMPSLLKNNLHLKYGSNLSYKNNNTLSK